MNPSSVTVEEAVARMVNMDYIPAGFSLLEMTDAFREEAEVDYENGQIDRLPVEEINKLKLRLDCCRVRHELTQCLMKTLNDEIMKLDDSLLIRSDEKSSTPRLTLDSVAWWASDRFGIGIPEWEAETKNSIDVRWEDVTIKIYKDNMIGYSDTKGVHKRKSFRELGLMAKRKSSPNQLGIILIGLSIGKKYPAGRYLQPNEKTAISKLRACLKLLTGIANDPFFPHNQTDGWIPRFNLIDDRRNADERAKEKIIFDSLDDKTEHELYEKNPDEEYDLEDHTPDFDEEGDDADKFLKNQKKGYRKPSDQ